MAINTDMVSKYHFCKTILLVTLSKDTAESTFFSGKFPNHYSVTRYLPTSIEKPQKPIIAAHSFKVQILFHQ